MIGSLNVDLICRQNVERLRKTTIKREPIIKKVEQILKAQGIKVDTYA